MSVLEIDKQSLFVLYSTNLSEIGAVIQLVLLLLTECMVILTFYVVFFRSYCYDGDSWSNKQSTIIYSRIIILCCLLNSIVAIVAFTPLSTSIMFGYWALDENFCHFTSVLALSIGFTVIILSSLTGLKVGVNDLFFKKSSHNNYTIYQLMLLNIVFVILLTIVFHQENNSFYKPLVELWPGNTKLCLMFNHPDVYSYRVIYSFYLGLFSAIALKLTP